MTASSSTGLESPPSAPSVESRDPSPTRAPGDGRSARAGHPSPFARLGAWAATHFRRVLVAWILVLLVFGFFAVHVESALAGAGWQASNSQSVAARAIIQKDFSGLGATGLQVVIVDRHGPVASDPQAQGVVAKATSVL